ncbi:MAG: hypothetical protein Q8P12_00155 [bacterium]|nr:hypothetical protein [bacterium]MDZ4231793.1 hypothetical protein [Candidatus Pacearchaeota archaeon]
MKQFFSSKAFLWIVIGAVALAVGYGFFVSGSPATQRALQFDLRRASDLQQISFAIDEYWARNAALPSALQDLQDQRYYYVESVEDPETGESYEYRKVAERSYELCAVFAMESGAVRAPLRFPSNAWEHGAGRACFELEVQPRLAP